MKKTLLFILMVALLLGTVQAANRFGDTYHNVQIVDETGRDVEDITNLYIYLAGTTTDATIYSDKGRQNTITIPMTEASTNTTLVDGRVSWWGPDTYDFSMTNTDGVGPMTNSGHADRSGNEGTLVFPTYLTSITTSSWLDGESITMGTGADWVINGGAESGVLTYTPAADNSEIRFGVSGIAKNTDFNVYVGTLLGLKVDAGDPSLTWDGGAVLLNSNSNFNVGINTGTSTGITSIGSATAGGFAVDTTAGITVNADDSYALTVTAGPVSLTADGASAGDVTIDAEDTMNLVSIDIKFFNGAAAETWEIEGTADAHEAQIVFTDPTADVVYTFPVAAASTLSVVTSTLATNAPDIANSVTGGTNQWIFEGATVDAHETIFTPEDPTADTVYTIPDAAAGTYGLVTSSLAANGFDIVNAVWGGTNQFIFEGATADAFETILTPTDATADATLTLPNDSGDLVYAPSGVVDYAAGAGALPITHVIITYESTGGAEALTLADGQPGQVLQVNHDTDGGNGVITPATALGYTSVDLADDGDMVTFQFVATQGWIIIGTAGNAAPPVVTP